ncbi:30S ribosomal protein S20 [Patescibacteria group bacterium]|nr:30S ribosomal protein S20 [Patescibacteria group bacterium]
MPIKKAAFKDLRQTKKRTKKNKADKDNIAYLVKKAKKAIEAKKTDEAKGFVQKAQKAIDKALQHGIMKKNTAARKKSSLAKLLNKPTK